MTELEHVATGFNHPHFGDQRPHRAYEMTPAHVSGSRLALNPLRSLILDASTRSLASSASFEPSLAKTIKEPKVVSSGGSCSDTSRPPTPPSPVTPQRATSRKREATAFPPTRGTPAPPNKRPYKRCGEAGYRGVTRRSHKWRAQLWHQGKLIVIGSTFSTPEDAARAFDEKSFELLGENALFNFPEEYNERVKALIESSAGQPSAQPAGNSANPPKKAKRKPMPTKQGRRPKKTKAVKTDRPRKSFVIAPESPPTSITFSDKDIKAAEIILAFRV